MKLRHSEDETLLDHIEALADALRARLRTGLEKDGVPLAPMEARALVFLQTHPGCSQADFVQSAGRDKAQVARLIKLLTERGLVVALPDREDRRVSRLWLTEEGQAMFRRVRELRLACGDALLQALDTRERARLGQLLAKAAGAAAEQDMAATPAVTPPAV